MVVELIYSLDCPNVDLARSHLVRAFAQVGQAPKWSEHVIGDPATPEHAAGYGSPTILIDRRDVSGAPAGANASCRLYRTEDGHLTRAPSIDQIATALSRATP